MGTSFHFGAGNSSLRETDEIFVALRTTLGLKVYKSKRFSNFIAKSSVNMVR